MAKLFSIFILLVLGVTNACETAQKLLLAGTTTETAAIPCSKDAGISQGFWFANFGGSPTCVVGLARHLGGPLSPVRCLMFFDVNGMVPAGSTILEGSLDFVVERSRFGENETEPYSLHMVTTDWNEGNERGFISELAEEGACTWNYSSSPNPWNTHGGDFDEVSFATFTPPPREYTDAIFASKITVQIAAEFLQELLDDSTKNKGFILLGDEAASKLNFRVFKTREGSSELVLNVKYETPTAQQPCNSSAGGAISGNISKDPLSSAGSDSEMIGGDGDEIIAESITDYVSFGDGSVSSGDHEASTARMKAHGVGLLASLLLAVKL